MPLVPGVMYIDDKLLCIMRKKITQPDSKRFTDYLYIKEIWLIVRT